MKRMSRVAALAAAIAAPVLLASGSAFAESSKPFSLFAPQEASFRFSYGISDPSEIRSYTFGPRVAYDLSFIPPIFDNHVRIVLELMGSFIHGSEHDLDGEFAFSPLIFDYRYDRGGVFVPFIEGGEGIVLTTIGGENIGGPFEFSSQGGLGAHFFFTTEDAVTFGVRYRHISNLGISDDNSGLDTFFITVGLSHFPDRR